MTITFTAYGVPAPKGSTKAFYRPSMRFPAITEDCKRTRPWAAIVKDAAMMVCGGPGSPITFQNLPVYLRADFHMPRPKTLPKKITAHLKKPDLDKLLRAVKDALTGVVWQDDSQVVTVVASKVYVREGEMPRVTIRVEAEEKIEPVSFPKQT